MNGKRNQSRRSIIGSAKYDEQRLSQSEPKSYPIMVNIDVILISVIITRQSTICKENRWYTLFPPLLAEGGHSAESGEFDIIFKS